MNQADEIQKVVNKFKEAEQELENKLNKGRENVRTVRQVQKEQLTHLTEQPL